MGFAANVGKKMCSTEFVWQLWIDSDDRHIEFAVVCRMIGALGPDVAVVALIGGLHVLTEAFSSYLGIGYRWNIVKYLTFNLHLFKQYLQPTASGAFVNLNVFSIFEFFFNWLKKAISWDWMAFRSALRRSIRTSDSIILDLVDIVANIFGVWALIVSNFKETGRKDDSDSLVVEISFFFSVSSIIDLMFIGFQL